MLNVHRAILAVTLFVSSLSVASPTKLIKILDGSTIYCPAKDTVEDYQWSISGYAFTAQLTQNQELELKSIRCMNGKSQFVSPQIVDYTTFDGITVRKVSTQFELMVTDTSGMVKKLLVVPMTQFEKTGSFKVSLSDIAIDNNVHISVRHLEHFTSSNGINETYQENSGSFAILNLLSPAAL